MNAERAIECLSKLVTYVKKGKEDNNDLRDLLSKVMGMSNEERAEVGLERIRSADDDVYWKVVYFDSEEGQEGSNVYYNLDEAKAYYIYYQMTCPTVLYGTLYKVVNETDLTKLESFDNR